MSQQNATTRQVGGQHYSAEFQHWDLVWRLKLGYFPGQITKYVSRWRKKNGAQDLEKARHFTEKYQQLLQDAIVSNAAPRVSLAEVGNSLRRYFAENPHLGQEERDICSMLSYDHTAAGLDAILARIDGLLEEARSAATPAYVAQ
jgi:Protein of unknwon function (DUF3310)